MEAAARKRRPRKATSLNALGEPFRPDAAPELRQRARWGPAISRGESAPGVGKLFFGRDNRREDSLSRRYPLVGAAGRALWVLRAVRARPSRRSCQLRVCRTYRPWNGKRASACHPSGGQRTLRVHDARPEIKERTRRCSRHSVSRLGEQFQPLNDAEIGGPRRVRLRRARRFTDFSEHHRPVTRPGGSTTRSRTDPTRAQRQSHARGARRAGGF